MPATREFSWPPTPRPPHRQSASQAWAVEDSNLDPIHIIATRRAVLAPDRSGRNRYVRGYDECGGSVTVRGRRLAARGRVRVSGPTGITTAAGSPCCRREGSFPVFRYPLKRRADQGSREDHGSCAILSIWLSRGERVRCRDGRATLTASARCSSRQPNGSLRSGLRAPSPAGRSQLRRRQLRVRAPLLRRQRQIATSRAARPSGGLSRPPPGTGTTHAVDGRERPVPHCARPARRWTTPTSSAAAVDVNLIGRELVAALRLLAPVVLRRGRCQSARRRPDGTPAGVRRLRSAVPRRGGRTRRDRRAVERRAAHDLRRCRPRARGCGCAICLDMTFRAVRRSTRRRAARKRPCRR